MNAWSLTQTYDPGIIDDSVIPAYSAIYPCAATIEAIKATDGLVIQDVMEWQSIHGFDVGLQSPIVGLPAVVPNDRVAIANAMRDHGAVGLGVSLPMADLELGTPWHTVQRGAEGHYVVAGWYNGLADDSLVWVAT